MLVNNCYYVVINTIYVSTFLKLKKYIILTLASEDTNCRT